MLLGLQQLFTASKATELGTKADQGMDLALLGNGEGMGEFGAELLAMLQGMNPEDAQAFLNAQGGNKGMSLNPDLISQLVQQLDMSSQAVETGSQDLAQKSFQSIDSQILEQVLENDGIKNKNTEKSTLKEVMNLFTNKSDAKVTSQTVNGANRSPAIDFAPENIDKKLLNFEDFTLQKNAIKKVTPQATYQGLEVKKELDLKSTEVVSGLGSQNASEFILNSMVDTGSTSSPLQVKTENSTPIFDGTQIKSADAKVIIDQISDYVMQARTAKEPTVNFKMNHQDLGQLDITVAKALHASDAVAINIGASALEGKHFFTQNLKELSTHLMSAGIQVSDIKVESTSSSQSKSDFDFNGQQKHADSGQKQFGSEQNQRRHEQEKRQSLWDLLSNKEAA